MNYAIIRLGGKQYKIEEGREIIVDKINGDKLEYEVLMLVNEGKFKLGTPIVKGAKIILKKLGEEKGEKLYVKKYKAKSRYRRKMGFRPQLTRLLVEKIV